MKKHFLILNFLLIFSITSSAQFHVQGEANVIIQGDTDVTFQELSFDNQGTFQPSFGDIIFREINGDEEITISNAVPTIFNDVILDLQTQNLKLLDPIKMNGSFTFLNGNVDLNDDYIFFEEDLGIFGENEQRSFFATNGGYLLTVQDLNGPAFANPGNFGAIISSGANLGPTILKRGHDVSFVNGSPSISRYYEIFPTNNEDLNAIFRFHYLDKELNGIQEEALSLWQRTDNIWENMGYVIADPSENFLEVDAIDAFSFWTAAEGLNPLPVELIDFTAYAAGERTAQLKWETATEINNHGFEIQRAVYDGQGGLVWENIGFEEGRGTTTNSSAYEFIDTDASWGTNYYRLRQIDFDGSSSLSIIRSVTFDQIESSKIGNVYPNPLSKRQHQLVLPIYLSQAEDIEINIFDLHGRLVFQQSQNLDKGKHDLNIPFQNWSTGIYMISGKINNNLFTQKIIITE